MRDHDRGNDQRLWPGASEIFEGTVVLPLNTRRKKNILNEEFSVAMTHELEEEMKPMCNLSQGIEDRALEKGRPTEEKALMGIEALHGQRFFFCA